MSSDERHKHPLAEDLIAWFTRNGGWMSPDVHIVHNESQGHHMRALRPTTPEVVACPLKLTLSSLNLDSDQKEVLPITSPLQQCRGRIPDHILTYLLLIEQRNKGNDSPWHHYIACLPAVESMTTPLWFGEEDVAFLAGTSLAPALKERKADYQKQWEHAVSVIREVGVAWADEVDFESLLWAATIFTSRAFISTHILPEIETVPILFPVVDILNHSVTAKVEWDFKPHQSFTLRCLDSSDFTVNEELFNNYAPKQNDELLLGYGFCLENNPIEQFALKLAFQPELMQYATQVGLMQPESVPFGMDTSFLQTDPNKEQHFLRAKGHPFGRYENHISFFRGIPPYIVHFFFIQTVLSLDLDLANINIAKPGERITLQVLTLLHQALTQRSSTLPLTLPLEPTNTKQRFAKSYRDGQAAVIHAVRSDLSSAISTLLIPSTTALPPRSALLTQPNGLAALRAEYPAAALTFEAGLRKYNLNDAQDDRLVWSLLLVAYAALILTNAENAGALNSDLLARLASAHPLPRVEDGIEDAETYGFLDEHLCDFLVLEGQQGGLGPGDVLDDLGVTFVKGPDGAGAFISEPTENLGVRLIMWAMSVAQADVVSVAGERTAEMCLFVRGEGEGVWLYDELEA
ncbi:SET domain-containing protein [Didymella exigua CBS 183.55]|uniref:SET domain-containing protein n=1 Tax=Didymella exigua CBS 183.55 TaxID=1150837 RepID=A0A6A5RXX3_9PLEO|nr:SET domain-containing protein [Didymella exigua CBS 183.55]KAF1930107.1 SET domain-containing protein [Didymella exigua CBS 183.55]